MVKMSCNGQLVLVATLLFSGSAYAEDSSLLLRYFFESESTQRVNVSAESQISLGGVTLSEGRGQAMLMSPTSDLGDGTTLVYQILKQTLRLNGEGVAVAFDTDNIETAITRGRLSQLSESVGHTFHRRVDDRGQVIFRDDNGVPASMVEMSLLTMPIFPEERLAIGDSWEAFSAVEINSNDQLLVWRRYSLESVIDGVAAATYDVGTTAFELEIETDMESTSLDAEHEQQVVSLVGTGRLMFDLQRGLLVNLSESTQLEGTLNGLPLSVSTDWEVVIE
jgi:hypothetical protein